jgi:hypothetical protein
MEIVSVLTTLNGTHSLVYLVPMEKFGTHPPELVPVLSIQSGMAFLVLLVTVEEFMTLTPETVSAHLD